MASLLPPVWWLKYDDVSIRNFAGFEGLYIKLFFKEILAATEITVLKTERVHTLPNNVGYLSCQNKYLLLVFLHNRIDYSREPTKEGTILVIMLFFFFLQLGIIFLLCKMPK